MTELVAVDQVCQVFRISNKLAQMLVGQCNPLKKGQTVVHYAESL